MREARALVDELMAAALERAAERGIPTDSVARCLLHRVIELYRQERTIEDVRSELAFTLEQLDDDQDFPFMRP